MDVAQYRCSRLRQVSCAESTGAPAQPAGFYGLDLYSLHVSRRAVIDYLDKVDPAAARDARSGLACFDHFHDPPRI